MELEGKRIAILVDQIYHDIELWYAYYRLKEAGAEVVLVGARAGETYLGKYGCPAVADYAYGDLAADDLAGVIVPGGYAPDHIRRHAMANNLVRDLDAQGKLVAAICHGGWVLCSASIMQGRRATCFFAIKDDLVNAGAEYLDAEVVVDGNLVTSRKPEDLPAFCRSLIAVLNAVPVVVH
jgi:protease I